jgi:hypothetical protein
VSWLTGNVSGLRGDASGLTGDASGLTGDVSGLRGDASGLRGDASGLKGSFDDCLLNQDERERGILIDDLISGDNSVAGNTKDKTQ